MSTAPGRRIRSMPELQMIDHAAVKQLQVRVGRLEESQSSQQAVGKIVQLTDQSQEQVNQFVAGAFASHLQDLIDRIGALENRITMMPKRMENTADAATRPVEKENARIAEIMGDFREEIVRLSQRMTAFEKEVREGYQKRRGRRPGGKRS